MISPPCLCVLAVSLKRASSMIHRLWRVTILLVALTFDLCDLSIPGLHISASRRWTLYRTLKTAIRQLSLSLSFFFSFSFSCFLCWAVRPRSSLLVVGQVLIWQVCRCREIEPSFTRDSPPAGCYWHTRIHTHTHKQSSRPQETLHRQVAIDVFSTWQTQLLAVWQGWDQAESPERCADTDMVTHALVFLLFQHAHPVFFHPPSPNALHREGGSSSD